MTEQNRSIDAAFGGKDYLRSRHRNRVHHADHHHILTAHFNIRCREYGAYVEALHIHDLTVYCVVCSPLCGSRGREGA